MNIFVKRAAIVLAAVVMTVGTGSCAGKSSSESSGGGHNMVGGDLGSDVNIAPEDMPYGSHMTKLTENYSGVPICIEYDSNFMTEDEGKLLSAYFSAINKKDAELYNEISFGPIVYEIAAMSETADAKEYIASLYDSIKSYAKEDFNISMLNVTGVEDASTPVIDNMLQTLAPNAEVTERKLVSVDAYYDTSEAKNCSLYSKSGSYVQIYIYTINGKPYIMA